MVAKTVMVPCDMKQLDLSGVSPEFAARLSAEDLEDIAVGDILLGTIQAFEQAAIAREAEDLRKHFEERAGIVEHDADLPSPDTEIEAAKITATLARNRGYLWGHEAHGTPALLPVRCARLDREQRARIPVDHPAIDRRARGRPFRLGFDRGPRPRGRSAPMLDLTR